MKTVLISLILSLALAACGEKTETAKENIKPVYKIGLSLPLSGAMADVGKVLKGAALLAEQEISVKNTKNTYQFIIEDNGFEVKRAAAVNNKFINVDKVNAIIDVGSKIGLITSPLAEKNKIIHIALATDMSVAQGKYNFLNWTQPEDMAKKLFEKILKDKLDNVVIFTEQDQAMIAIAEELKKQFFAHQIYYIEKRNNHGEKDFNSIIAEVQTIKPQIFVLLEYSPSMNVLLKRLKALESRPLITSVETFGYLDDKSEIEGLWYSDAPDLKGEYYTKFVNFNQSENVYGTGFIYDTINFLITAAEKSKHNDVLSSIKGIKEYEGIVGTLTQDEDGILHSKAVIKTIKDGKPVVLED